MSGNVKQGRNGNQRAEEPVALITGGSAGLGRALATGLAAAGWTVVTDARGPGRLAELIATHPDRLNGIVGDVGDPDHRQALAAEVRRLGRLDLLVHNASSLGPVPLRPLRELGADQLRAVWATNVDAPLALTQLLLEPLLASDGVLLSISSDAALEHYQGWGGYGASKAALDHLTLTFGTESPLTAYAVDPGDMRTQMHQDAFLGEDISDRPLPETVVPQLLALLAARPPSGRYRAADIAAAPGRVS
ncbi:SDR family NAD(P)-dependent oxidoreductase [Nakamurella lactea]|uniref:SDR family NAD(P)-dependent oxidoreductase n=1 Tax=Nakamurella lactea TaxID=459515 RepID=UPI0006875624|nr:SDR family oxidoreductase [Nakamurella lactea]